MVGAGGAGRDVEDAGDDVEAEFPVVREHEGLRPAPRHAMEHIIHACGEFGGLHRKRGIGVAVHGHGGARNEVDEAQPPFGFALVIDTDALEAPEDGGFPLHGVVVEGVFANPGHIAEEGIMHEVIGVLAWREPPREGE